MRLTITYYLEVVSSWCFWSERTWAELKQRYANRPVDFVWKIALMDATGFPVSRTQMDWFYRRSGTLMRSPFMLNSAWYEAGVTEYLPPNLIAEAARDLGVTDDGVRIAIATAAVLRGERVGQWEIASKIGGEVGKLDRAKLLERARSPEIEQRIRATTAEFHALQVTQRPTFVVDSDIGDRAVFSGIAVLPPIAAAIDAMLNDIVAYESYAAHFGLPPAS
jgi:predicted DsbA family dithiol-disulfide isomerase